MGSVLASGQADVEPLIVGVLVLLIFLVPAMTEWLDGGMALWMRLWTLGAFVWFGYLVYVVLTG